MDRRIINILAGVLFAVSGIFTLLDGVYNMRASNLLIGISFIVVGALYLIKRKQKQ